MDALLKTLDGNEHRIAGSRPDVIPCFRCGECCTYLLVKLSPHDMHVLTHGLGVSNKELWRRYVRRTLIGPVLRQAGDRCIFLKQDGAPPSTGCSIYEIRPEVCRGWAPGLSCPECLRGLAAAGKAGRLLLLHELYHSREDISSLCSAVDTRT
jgi:hypothetical protein